jgi:hypothetical protein
VSNDHDDRTAAGHPVSFLDDGCRMPPRVIVQTPPVTRRVRDHALMSSPAADDKRRLDAAMRLWESPAAVVRCPVNQDADLYGRWLPGSADKLQGSFFVECPACGWSMNIRASDPPEGLPGVA